MEATNHMGKDHSYYHLSNFEHRDKPYSNLKPGQKELERDYYGKATHEQPSGQACLTNYGRFDSIYNQNVSATVRPTDYKVPNKNANTMRKYSYTLLYHRFSSL